MHGRGRVVVVRRRGSCVVVIRVSISINIHLHVNVGECAGPQGVLAGVLPGICTSSYPALPDVGPLTLILLSNAAAASTTEGGPASMALIIAAAATETEIRSLVCGPTSSTIYYGTTYDCIHKYRERDQSYPRQASKPWGTLSTAEGAKWVAIRIISKQWLHHLFRVAK